MLKYVLHNYETYNIRAAKYANRAIEFFDILLNIL